MRTTTRERDAAYIRSAERVLQRTETAGRLTSSASADTLLRNLSRMTRLAKWYRDAYELLLEGPKLQPICNANDKAPSNEAEGAINGGIPDVK